MKILYGTTNKGKLQAMQKEVQPLDIESGKYYYDLEEKDVSTSVDGENRKFFSTILLK